MASNTDAYTFYHADRDGKLFEKYDPTDVRATCLIDSINIIQAMLKEDTVKSAFAQTAAEYCEYRKYFRYQPWFLEKGQGTREEKTNSAVAEFLKMFQIPVFPTLCVSDRLRNLNVTGAYSRTYWEDPFPLFSQLIVLNGVVSRKPTRSKCFLAS